MFQTCLDFLASSEPQQQCEPVYLGPEMGFVSIMEYHDEDGSCKISSAELYNVCSGAMLQTCLDFLASAEQVPQCESVFLGPDIGFVNVMAYNDADGSCQISMVELQAVCRE